MPVDWTKLHRRFKGRWIALRDDEKTVIGTGKTAKEATEKARKKGVKDPILARIPDRFITYVGSNL